MSRDRNERGEYADGIDPETVMDVFDARDDVARPLTAADVVDELGIARRTAHNKLTALVERGELETRKIGARARVWWRPVPRDDLHAQGGGMSDDPPEEVVDLQTSGEVDWLAAGREEQDADSDGEPTDAGVPDSDPRHLDPAGDLADLVESGELELSLGDDADREELRAFIEAAERRDDPVDPGDEAVVRIARELLSDDGSR